MPVFSRVTTTLSAILALTSTVVQAAPFQPVDVNYNHHLSTHRRNFGPNNVEFVSYYPPSSYKTFQDGAPSLLSRSANATRSFVPRDTTSGVSSEVEDAALSYLSEQTGIAKDSLEVRSGFTNDFGTTHVYITQVLNGIPVTNGVANLVFDKDGKVIAFSSNIVKPDQISPATPSFPQSSAIQSAERSLGLTRLDSVPVTLSYVIQSAPSADDPNRKWAILTHKFQLRNADQSKWVQAYVDATNPEQGNVIHVVDFVANAAYNVVEWGHENPTDSGFDLVENPADLDASPNGWHHDSAGPHTDTRGNNVLAFFGTDDHAALTPVQLIDGRLPPDVITTQQSSDDLVFDYKWDPTTEPSTPSNLDVARVNAFYVVNKFHDIMYKYGFTEEAYNFQDDNYGKGGAGSDWVEMQVQASGFNRARFATPADGTPGHCNMHLWDFTDPMGDGALENNIVIHELTHGLTNRMTGGGTSECLVTTEANGLGEGWSDAVAFWSEQKDAMQRPFVLGAWVTDNPNGVRRYPYSTHRSIDPLMYSDVTPDADVHAIGEVWATMLVEVYWELIGDFDFSEDIANPHQDEGNIVFLHLLIDALPIQPCNPTFVQARDAILMADAIRYGVTYKCWIWKAFAKRGLGVGAANYTDDDEIPAECRT